MVWHHIAPMLFESAPSLHPVAATGSSRIERPAWQRRAATDAVPAYIFPETVATGSQFEPGATHWRFDVALLG